MASWRLLRRGGVLGPALAVLLAGAACTVTGTEGGPAPTDGGATRPATVGLDVPGVTLTPVDPGPPPALDVPPRLPGEVARVVVTRDGAGKAFRTVPGVPVVVGRTYVVEAACSAPRAASGTSYAIYDAAPGTWGHGEPLWSRPFPCDGSVQRTVNLGLPAGRVQVDVRGLPPDAVAAYAVVRPG